MNDVEKAWVAGLLEGEGSFMWRKSNSAKVSCQMTDIDVIFRLHKLIGGKVYKTTKSQQHHKDAWVCVVSGISAVELMEDIGPLMGLRRGQRILEVLETYYKHEIELTKKHGETRQNALMAADEYLGTNRSLRDVAKDFGISHVTLKNVLDRFR